MDALASSSSPDKEVVLYPAYIDSEKTWKGGRRVPKVKAVERPHAVEMYDAITKGLCLKAKLEMDKRYSRDWMTPGRVRVKLRRTDGAPYNTDIPTKSVLLVKCSELCAKHQDRPRRLEDMKKFETQLFSGGGPPAKESKASSSGGDKAAKGSNKKKGKKK